MFTDRIYISPSYTPEDYEEINLNNNSSSEDWEKAIEIFSDRIYGRFLNAIDILMDGYNDFSFSSMAIMCLLIETLHQFYYGLDKTEWRKHEEAFINFLTTSKYFESNFGVIEARRFYKHIRNGIIHQAQTQGNTQLTINALHMVELVPRGIRVDVGLFHRALKDEVRNYIDRLRSHDNHIIRENFIRKMGFIVRNG